MDNDNKELMNLDSSFELFIDECEDFSVVQKVSLTLDSPTAFRKCAKCKSSLAEWKKQIAGKKAKHCKKFILLGEVEPVAVHP